MLVTRMFFAFVAVAAINCTALRGDGCPPKYTNKTFLKPRSHGVNLALTHQGFSKLLRKHDCSQETFLAQAVVFQSSSVESREIGAYFGINNTNTFSLRDLASAAGLADAIPLDAYNISLSLRPKQNAYGAVFSCYRSCPHIWEGLFVEADFPVVHVEQDLRAKLSGNQQAVDFFSAFYAGQSVRGKALAGAGVQAINGNDLTEQRQHALIGGKQSLNGLADIDVRIGKEFYRNHWLRFAAKLGLTIPTSPKPQGRYLFEPVLGNGQHWACGGDASAKIKLCKHDKHRLSLDLAGRYRWLFRGDERRMVESALFGQLANPLLIDTHSISRFEINSLRFSSADSYKLHVEPRHQFDGIAALNYRRRWFTADLGYNLYYRAHEQLAFKDATGVITQRGLAGLDVIGSDAVVPFNTTTARQATQLVADQKLALSSAVTPAQLSHKIYGGIGCVHHSHDGHSYMLGVGGHYEAAQHNSALSNWGINARVAVSF